LVVQGLIALALALPTGMLFGVGYGTGVRIGYEQVYPLLFPKANSTNTPNSAQVADNLKSINRIYDTIGGKEASNMGIAMGLNSVRSATENNPDFRYLEELESRISGRTPSNLDPHNKSSTESLAPQEFSDVNLSFDDKIFLLNQIDSASMADLLRMKRTFTDSNLLQKIRTRINKLAEELRIKNQFGNTTADRANIGTNVTPQTLIQKTHGTEINAYKFEIARLQNLSRSFNLAYFKIKKASGGITTDNAQMKKQKASSLRVIKMIMNLITQSRNITYLKPFANNDWNKRIWQKHAI